MRDGDWRVRGLLSPHYSARHYRDGRRPLKSMGPGQYLLLLTPDARAVFGWVTAVNRRDGQEGVINQVFRNTGPVLSSDLVREACALAWARWPGRRLFTYVDPRKVLSPNPGYCYLRAGWRGAGYSPKGLRILEILPNGRTA